MFVKINTETNQVAKYPYSLNKLREDFPNTSFPEDEILSQMDLTEYGVFKIRSTPRPSVDSFVYGIVELDPTFVDGMWTQQWQAVERGPEGQALEKQNLITDITVLTQIRLDKFATTRGYDNVNSIAKYKDISDEEIATLPVSQQVLVTKFRTESRYLALATANTWAKLFVILSEVEAGTRPVPAGFADIEPDLPELVWPV